MDCAVSFERSLWAMIPTMDEEDLSLHDVRLVSFADLGLGASGQLTRMQLPNHQDDSLWRPIPLRRILCESSHSVVELRSAVHSHKAHGECTANSGRCLGEIRGFIYSSAWKMSSRFLRECLGLGE